MRVPLACTEGLAIDTCMVEHAQIIACEPPRVGDNYAQESLDDRHHRPGRGVCSICITATLRMCPALITEFVTLAALTLDVEIERRGTATAGSMSVGDAMRPSPSWLGHSLTYEWFLNN